MSRLAPALLAVVGLVAAGAGPAAPAPIAKRAVLVVKVNSLEADIELSAASGTPVSKCGQASGSTTCTATVSQGTKVDVTVYPNQTWVFSGWGGACRNTPKATSGHTQEFTCVLKVQAPRTVATATMSPRL